MFLFLAGTLSGKMKNDVACGSVQLLPAGGKNPVGNAFAAGKQGAPATGCP